MPISGAQNRQTPVARMASITETAKVTVATTIPAPGADPSGTAVRRSNPIDITITAINIRAIPLTTGVMIRRNSGSQAASANCTIEAATKRLASVASPASDTVRTAIERAMKCGPAPLINRCPAPSRFALAACRAVITPAMISAEKTAHAR